jgi:hypothetical protein
VENGATLGVYRKLAQAWKSLAYLRKSARVEYGKGGGYQYTPAADVTAAVHGALVTAGLIVGASRVVAVSGDHRAALVTLEVDVIDPEDGSRTTFQGTGAASDSGDKALSKANTIAMRYLWLGAFQIATGDEDIAEHHARICLDGLRMELASCTEPAACADAFVAREAVLVGPLESEAKKALAGALAKLNVRDKDAIRAMVEDARGRR